MKSIFKAFAAIAAVLFVSCCYMINKGRRSRNNAATQETSSARKSGSRLSSKFGFGVNPHSCQITGRGVQPHAGAAGEETSFEILQFNSLNASVSEKTDGFTATFSAGGPSTIIPSLEWNDVSKTWVGTYTARRSGLYTLSIKFKDQHLNGSPFSIRISAGEIDPSQCVMNADIGRVPIGLGENVNLTLKTYDSLGNQRTTGGDAESFVLQCEQYEDLISFPEDRNDGSYSLHFAPPFCGIFHLKALYKKQPIEKSLCTINVLPRKLVEDLRTQFRENRLEMSRKVTLVQSSMAASSSEASSSSSSPPIPKKERTVTLSIKGNQLSIIGTKYLLFSDRLLCLRLRKARIELHPSEEDKLIIRNEKYRGFQIRDCRDRNALYGVYQFLLSAQDRERNNGQSMSIETRQTLLKTEFQRYAAQNQITWGRSLSIRLNRASIIKTALSLQPAVFNFAKIEVKFDGEEGLDRGGLSKEFFTVLARLLFFEEVTLSSSGQSVRLFCPYSNPSLPINPSKAPAASSSSSFAASAPPLSSDSTSRLHPNRAINLDSSNCLISKSSAKEELLSLYRLCGVILAKSLFDVIVLGRPHRIKAPLTRSCWKALLGLTIDSHDMSVDDPQFYTGTIKYITKNLIDDAGLELTFADYDYFVPEDALSTLQQNMKLVNLLEGERNASAVTDANKMEYIHLLSEWRSRGCVSKQMDAFTKGFHSVLPEELMASVFSEEELELSVCGCPEIDAADWKKHTRVSGFEQNSKVIGWFFQAVELLTQEERARLLCFVTGSTQLPPNGFAGLAPGFAINRSYSGSLPRSHTCFNTIDLPDYPSLEQLQRNMLIALNFGSEGFGIS